MDSIVSTFHIDWKIIIAQAVNFGVVFVVLYIFALKPLAVLMLKRTEKILKGIADAKTNATLLEQTRIEHEKVIDKAKKEANLLYENRKREVESNRTKMIEAAKTEADEIIREGKKTLEAEKNKIIEEAKKEIVTLAMLATEKLISSKSEKELYDL